MSTYYDFYLAYMKNGKLYPLGPFNRKQKLESVLSKSQSFISDMYYDFWDLPADKIGPELKEIFTYKDWNGDPELADLKYLQLEKLPTGSIVRKGYFLIEDVNKYEQGCVDEEIFYEYLSPVAYAAKAANEERFGPVKPRKDIEGNEFDTYSANDYMYYAYIDKNTKEYEASEIRNIANLLIDYDDEIDYKDIYVILQIG